MTNELDIQKKVIVMRKGGEIWIEEAKAEKLEQLLAAGTTTRFVKIDEHTINVVDIEGIYTAEQIGDKHRMAAGETRCQYGNWHMKRERCDCATMIRKRHNETEQAARRAEEARPMTAEEQEVHQGKMQSVREVLEKQGVLKPREKNV